ncbi:MAG: molybdopterin dinucleotide binding domain-containing protein, partial [Myxococcota bacterium]
RDVAKWSPRVFDPPADGKDDWQILFGLAQRLGKRRGWKPFERVELAGWKRLGPDGLVNAMLRAGPYGVGRGGLSLARLKQHPHGLDLGPLRKALPKRLPRGHRFIELAPEPLLADLPRALARADAGAPAADEMLLIGRRHLRSNNSWMHNEQRLASGKPRCTLIVHPDDAARLGLVDGAAAAVRSRVGEVVLPVEVSDEMMPGVVSLPHGFGHDRSGVRLGVAGQADKAGVSMNDLTDELLVDPVCGTAVLNGVRVVVSAARAGA